MKRKYIFIMLLFSLFFPTIVNARNDVGYNLGKYECTSKYQDRNISTNTSANFSHCVLYYKENNKCIYEYYDDERVNCLNGNTDPYYSTFKDGCTQTKCTNEIKYCSIIITYDCSRKRNGDSFTTTTKTTSKIITKAPTTTKVTTTTSITTTEKIVSTKLKSLSLSKGTIIFSPDINEYNLNLNEEDSFVDVTAIPEDELCKVDVIGNNEIVDGSVIIIKVTAPNGNINEYKIIVKVNKKLSNNAKLSSLSVIGYSIPFSSKINEYSIFIDEGVNELSIDYQVEDENASVLISDNSNLKNGSRVTISVVAEDGTENYYYINISVKEKSNFLSILFIIVIVLAVIAGGYYLYRKFVLSKNGDKYEYE